MRRARATLHRMTTPTRSPNRWPDRDPTLMAVLRPLAAASALLDPTGSDLANEVRELIPAFLSVPDGIPDTGLFRFHVAPLIHQLSRGEEGGPYREAAALLIEAGKAAGGLDAWHEQRQPRTRRKP